jgi:hypothetical protein
LFVSNSWKIKKREKMFLKLLLNSYRNKLLKTYKKNRKLKIKFVKWIKKKRSDETKKALRDTNIIEKLSVDQAMSATLTLLRSK